MYQITCDDCILYDVRDDEYMLYAPSLHLGVNSAGTLTFTIYETHPYFDRLKKLRSEIRVWKDNRIIWKGRITDDKKNFDGDWYVKCEGKLAFFNDSVMRKFEFKGSPEKFLKKIIENHNSQVQEFQRFKAGVVTVQDANEYIVRSSETNLITFEVLRSRVFESTLGGYLNIRYENDGDYIDWLSDFHDVSKQQIQFGENMLDLIQETSAEETYTAMIPQGAADINGSRIGIESVNDGKDYIVNEEVACQYGVIYAPDNVSIWDDVTEPENLLKKATEYLNSTGIKLKETIELRAFDLNLTDTEVESFNFCEYIPVISAPHGINRLYLLREMNIPFDEPQNMVITMGESRLTLADMNFGSSDGGNESVLQKVEEIEKSIPNNVSDLENDAEFQTKDDVIRIVEENTPQLVSPVLLVKTSTDTDYVLTVTDANGTYDTPNLKGAAGEKGETGETGLAGENGVDGRDGAAATIAIGTVITGEAGTAASVENAGTENAAVLNFVIPRGNKGEAGTGGGSGGSNNMFGFEIREDGHLWASGETENVNNFYISDQGHLIYRIGGSAE